MIRSDRYHEVALRFAKEIDEWQALGAELRSVIKNFLEEFEDMARGSDHEQEALLALERLDELMWRDESRPAQ